MSQLRFDYTTSDWVVFAPLRKLRPHAEPSLTPSAAGPGAEPTSSCPFCPGSERLTPREISSVKGSSGASSQWQVRVIPNRFPALRIEEDHHRHELGRRLEYMGGSLGNSDEQRREHAGSGNAIDTHSRELDSRPYRRRHFQQ